MPCSSSGGGWILPMCRYDSTMFICLHETQLISDDIIIYIYWSLSKTISKGEGRRSKIMEGNASFKQISSPVF